jgi:hypothetical protein
MALVAKQDPAATTATKAAAIPFDRSDLLASAFKILILLVKQYPHISKTHRRAPSALCRPVWGVAVPKAIRLHGHPDSSLS